MIPSYVPQTWVRLSFDIARLGIEANALIGLRLFRMATGGVPAVSEAGRMVPEKVAALAEAQGILALGLLTGAAHASPEKVVRLYRRRVRANRRRLIRPRRPAA